MNRKVSGCITKSRSLITLLTMDDNAGSYMGRGLLQINVYPYIACPFSGKNNHTIPMALVRDFFFCKLRDASTAMCSKSLAEVSTCCNYKHESTEHWN